VTEPVPHWRDENLVVHHGDCLDVMRQLPDASVDAVVTDPPYGLAEHPRRNVEKALLAWLTGDREHVPNGRGFMGRDWDAFVPPPAVWDEAMRVLKPGGHLLAFCAPRTYDLMAMSIRLAGLDADAAPEIRDAITWLYGSGFPKSRDVSKAIDKRPGVSCHREFAQHLAEQREAEGLSRADVSERIVGTRSGACWNWEHHQFPEAKWWPALRDLLSLDPSWDAVIAEAEREVIGHNARPAGWFTAQDGHDLTASATHDARRWQGWGTALKPASEPIVVARKPLAGTVAHNVLTYGTGALNIGACRVAAPDAPDEAVYAPNAGSRYAGVLNGGQVSEAEPRTTSATSAGRWPSNVVLSHVRAWDGTDACADGCVQGCPVAELDRQSGFSVSPTSTGRGAGGQHGAYSSINGQGRVPAPGDSGGASRFFPVFRYEAKAPSSERPRADDIAHPTVKPLDLMRWLVQLVTPPGGTVLDPFAGSGTTGEACLIEGFGCILIERDDSHMPLIIKRLSKPIQFALPMPGEEA
jgi:DNA modification methylase